MAKKKKSDNTFFLRFYNQSDANIDKCIGKIKSFGHNPTKVTKGPLTTSVNFMFEGSGVEVLLTFNSWKEMLACRDDERVPRCYHKYASGKKEEGMEVVKRKPGDVAFSV